MPTQASRFALATAALLAAVVVFLLFTLPPAPAAAGWTGDRSIPGRTISGAYHVHSTRSDGAGDRAAIAAAARRAGLQFVIVTDHGDGTAMLPPAYVDGVLCIDGVEISTNSGHYVALGLAEAPYPLGGEAAAVVEDVARFGGFGLAAHTDSPKPSLAWTDWDVPFDGIEWLNADTEWRNESRVRLMRVLFDYVFRPGPALASVLDRPAGTLARWDALTTRRPVLALAGHDAHGGVTTMEEGQRVSIGGVPSYEASFRSFTTRVVLDEPLKGNAASDAARMLGAIRRGRVFTAIDALASPAFLDFSRAGPLAVEIHASTPPGARVVLLRNGQEIDPTAVDWLQASGAYRVEVRLPGAPGEPPIPWLVSNPLYFLSSAVTTAEARPTAIQSVAVDWHVEKDDGSIAMLHGAGVTSGGMEFRLRAGERVSQFAALVADLKGERGGATHLAFGATASRPMRVSAQLRYPSGSGGERWARSFYVDASTRRVTIPLADVLPVDGQTGRAPDPSRATSVLFVIDLVNARPGDGGTLRVTDLALGR